MIAWWRKQLAIVLFTTVAGCSFRIVPPAIEDGGVVFVADHGYHASLLLPDQEGQWHEYAYGEMDWFALGRDALWRILPALFWPTEGTFGRRSWSFPDGIEAAEVGRRMHVGSVLSFVASPTKIRALRESLDANWERPRPSHYSPYQKLNFVPSDDKYWVRNNCNAALVDWLRQLSCDVRGYCFWANFTVDASVDQIAHR